jgi:serine/threonine-protein kinase
VTTGADPNDSQIALPSGTMQHKILFRGGTYGRYVPTGHLVYYRSGTIMAVPFDPDRLELQGTPAPVQEGVLQSAANTGAGQFTFSERGTLVYVPGSPQQGDFGMVWVDRKGTEQSLPLSSAIYTNVRLSPDGQRSALVLENDIWIYDLSRDTLTRLTFEGVNSNAQWTPDGKRIAFNSSREGSSANIYWKLADGTGPEERLTTSANGQFADSFTPDGKTLLYNEADPKTGVDLWVLPLDGERKPRLYLQTPFNERTSRISPDGRWVAYLSGSRS